MECVDRSNRTAGHKLAVCIGLVSDMTAFYCMMVYTWGTWERVWGKQVVLGIEDPAPAWQELRPA